MDLKLLKELVKRAYEENDIEKRLLLPFQILRNNHKKVFYETLFGDVEEIIVNKEYQNDTEIVDGFYIPKRTGTIVKETCIQMDDGFKKQTIYYVFTQNGWAKVEI